MRYSILLFLALFALNGISQDSISKPNDGVLIVVYEPKMYRSTIDYELAQKADISREELRRRIRFGLDDNLFLELKGRDRVVSLLREDTSSTFEGQYRIYDGIGYSYELIPGEEEKDAETGEDKKPLDKITGKMDNLLKKKKELSGNSKHDESHVQNGQVVSQVDNREKYMKTVIHDPSLLRYIQETYQVNKVLFINQLDLLVTGDEYGQERKIQIHYTAFKTDGTEITSGAQSSYFPAYLNDLKEIINKEFYHVTNTVAKNF